MPWCEGTRPQPGPGNGTAMAERGMNLEVPWLLFQGSVMGLSTCGSPARAAWPRTEAGELLTGAAGRRGNHHRMLLANFGILTP